MFKSRIDYKPCTLFPLKTENSFNNQVVGIDEVLPALPDPVIGEAEEDQRSDGGPIFYQKETSHLTNPRHKDHQHQDLVHKTLLAN